MEIGGEVMKIEQTSFHGRKAVRLSNGQIRLTALRGGGHIAELSLTGTCVNPLWQPNWETIEPLEYDPQRYPEYGDVEGKLLSSITGHVLCLNHFGELSEAELAADGYEHGEAAHLPWTVLDSGADADSVWLEYGVFLPEAGMRVTRRVVLRRGEAIAHFEEQVTNLRRSDSPLAYQQHVTLGAPFVEPGVTRLDVSGTRGHTFPRSFGAADPLEPNAEFRWPNGPGGIQLDRFPPQRPLSTMCTVAVEPSDGETFVAASNPRLGLLLAYVFPDSFPWVALWYENGGTTYAPYNGESLAWGVEFGTCALPTGRIEMMESGPLLGRRRFGVLPAGTTLRASYDAILQTIPTDWRGVASIGRWDGQTVITERETGREVRVGGER
jgi:hypothetical protein